MVYVLFLVQSIWDHGNWYENGQLFRSVHPVNLSLVMQRKILLLVHMEEKQESWLKFASSCLIPQKKKKRVKIILGVM